MSCFPLQFPSFKNSRPKRAWSSVLMNSPPPECPPPDTDCIRLPSSSIQEFLYPYHRHVGLAPIGSIMCSFKTCGNGLRHVFSREYASTLTRTSLYSKCVPGV